jgi:hypothetical protein
MNHDFKSLNLQKLERFSRNGETCTNIGAAMDYGQAHRWSRCSVEDFTTYYNKVLDTNGRFCLDPIGNY